MRQLAEYTAVIGLAVVSVWLFVAPAAFATRDRINATTELISSL